jgi:hypothetical protein
LKLLKKNERLVELETEDIWVFHCKTRGPDIDNGPGLKPTATWICILSNKVGDRRFIPETKIGELYKRREAAVKAAN